MMDKHLFLSIALLTYLWQGAQAGLTNSNSVHSLKLKRDANKACLIPEPLSNGSFRNHRRRCTSSNHSPECRLVPGTLVQENWLLYYNCNSGYQLSVEARASICKNGQWVPALPACVPQLTIISREGWGAQNGPEFAIHQLPLNRVIIEHTATDLCTTKADCILTMQSIQQFHVQQFGDIGYNFLIGGDGSVFEGQGWTHAGAHTYGFNTGSIGVALIGNFVSSAAPEAMLNAAQRLIELGLSKGKISPDYKLSAHCQLIQIASPGLKVFNVIKHWPNWDSSKALQCTQ